MLLLLLTILLSTPSDKVVAPTTGGNPPSDKLLEKIKAFVPRCAKQKLCKMMADTIRIGCKDFGFKPKDYNTILALIKKESDGRHIPGRGEWGVLQVVPWEKHIKKLVRKYRCLPGEKKCKCVVKGSRRCTYKKPDVFYRKRNSTYNYVSGVKSSRFLKANPRAALYIGIGEMAYWRKMYHARFKYKFWGKGRRGIPKKYIKAKLQDHYRKARRHKDPTKRKKWENYYARTEKWWYRVTRSLGSKMWIVHHNYGFQIRVDDIGHFYPIIVARYLRRLKKLDNK